MFQVKERVCKSTESRVSMTGLGFMQWKLNSIIKVENSLKDELIQRSFMATFSLWKDLSDCKVLLRMGWR